MVLHYVSSQATRTGIGHVSQGTPNQDAYATIIKEDEGVAVLVVADGAGSLSLSHVGSSEAVRVASESVFLNGLNRNSDREDLERIVADAIFEANDTLCDSEDAKQLGCTIAVAVITPNGWATACYGDSFTVIQEADEFLFVTGEQEHEFANVTNLLGRTKDIVPTVESGTSVPVAVAVSTDGLLRISVERNQPTPGFWNTVFSPNGIDGDAFLEFLERKGKLDDDTTFSAVRISHTGNS